jgi:hypothetical protein
MISGFLSPQHSASLAWSWRNRLQYGEELWMYWMNSHGQPTRGGTSAWGLGEVLTAPNHKKWLCYTTDKISPGLDGSFGTLTWVASELLRYKWDLVGVQEVRWDTDGTIRAGDFILFYKKETNIINWEQDFVHHRTVLAVNTFSPRRVIVLHGLSR